MQKRRTHLKISVLHCSKISDSVLLFTAVKTHYSCSFHPVNGLKIDRLLVLKETLKQQRTRGLCVCVCIRVRANYLSA
jgi:hypothetical protein